VPLQNEDLVLRIINVMPRRVILVSSYFPPSNQVSIHRARLLGNQLRKHGWEPVVLAVSPNFYEEPLDPYMEKLVEPNVKVIRVNAIPQKIARSLGWGDIGLRGFPYMLKALVDSVNQMKADLVFITLPSNYQALLGRILFEYCRTPYILDYQDPWINESDLKEPFLGKAWITQFLAKKFEPLAVARVAGISGITSAYFQNVVRRHPELSNVPQLAFQMGFSYKDHEKARELKIQPRRIDAAYSGKQIVYAGALLPKAIDPMLCFLEALGKVNKTILKDSPLRFVCLGTGSSANDPKAYRILPLAERVGAGEWVDEYPERHPFLEVLSTLQAADAVAVIGSVEPHYSPSKLFQGALSGRPLFTMLHEKSEATSILKKAKGGINVTFGDDVDKTRVVQDCFDAFQILEKRDVAKLDLQPFEEYDASVISKRVAAFFNEVVEYHGRVY